MIQKANEKPRTAGGPCGVYGKQNENRRNHYIEPWELWELAKAACVAELGLEIRDDVRHVDGRVNYVGAIEDRKGHRPIRVFVHADIPQNIHITDMKRGHQWTWYPQSQQSLTPAEREQRRREIDAHRAKREADEQARHRKRAAWACKIWQSATPADGSHHYLVRKGVKAHGLRLLPVWENSRLTHYRQYCNPQPRRLPGFVKSPLNRGRPLPFRWRQPQ